MHVDFCEQRLSAPKLILLFDKLGAADSVLAFDRLSSTDRILSFVRLHFHYLTVHHFEYVFAINFDFLFRFFSRITPPSCFVHSMLLLVLNFHFCNQNLKREFFYERRTTFQLGGIKRVTKFTHP